MDIVSFVMGMSAAGEKDKTELLENVEIPVDFSNGDQFIEVPEGQAVKSAIIQKPETLVSENIAEGINIAGIVGTHSGGLLKEVLLEEQTINDFAPAGQFGNLYAGIVYQEIDLEVGKKYFVKWDGGEYEVVGQDASAAMDVAKAVGIGNGEPFGLQGNNEPFAIISANSNGVVALSYDTKTSHTFEIYKKVETGGGSSASYSYYAGSFTATDTIQTVQHGLDKVPDILLVTAYGIPEADKVYHAVGYSQAMIDKLGGGYLNKVYFIINTDQGPYLGTVGSEEGIEGPSEEYEQFGVIRNATDTEFTIGGTRLELIVGKNYTIEAIGGFTDRKE